MSNSMSIANTTESNEDKQPENIAKSQKATHDNTEHLTSETRINEEKRHFKDVTERGLKQERASIPHYHRQNVEAGQTS
jgi:hypothetical protein